MLLIENASKKGGVIMVKTLIMAGGMGERLWPVSVKKRPKQFHGFGSSLTMIEDTVERMGKVTDEVFIITTGDQFPLIRYYIPHFPVENVIFEPMGRNTAPAIALGSTRFEADDIMIVVPSDHIIRDEETFVRTLKTAISCAEKSDVLVTIGITPTSPNTGYGYIERGNSLSDTEEVFAVKKFHEKPDYETAQHYFQSGKYLWNSGMFVWRKRVFDRELAEHLPDLHGAMEKLARDPSKIDEIYEKLPKISIDYGLMEKSSRVNVVPASFYWNDIGSWDAVYDLMHKDNNGNAISGDFSLYSVKNCLLINHTKNSVGIADLEGYIVVVSHEGTLVCRRGESQNIKEIIK